MNGFKKGDRWAYSAKKDKLKFISSMYIISLAALLQYFLLKELPGIIYAVLSYFIQDSRILEFFAPQEANHMLFDAMAILTTFFSCAATGFFIVACLKKFGPRTNILGENDSVSYRFKLPDKTPALLLAGVCMMEFCSFAYLFLNIFLDKFFNVSPIPPSGSQAYFPQTFVGIILYFVSLVAVPALAEEFVCRYMMLNALKKYGNTFAIVSTSVFFGFMHAKTSAFIYATAMGFFLAYVAIKTKSVWFSVLLHALVNFISFVFQYLSSLAFLYEESVDILYLMFCALIFLACAVYLFVLIAKKKHRYNRLDAPAGYIHIPKKQKLLFFFNFASIIFFVLTILRSLEEYGFMGFK